MIKGALDWLNQIQYNLALDANKRKMTKQYKNDTDTDEIKKGRELEIKIKRLLFLCKDVKVIRATPQNELDGVLKIDLLISISEGTSNEMFYGIQIKSSEHYTDEFLEKYEDGIIYKDVYYECPAVFFPSNNQSNVDILAELCEVLYLQSDIDDRKLQDIYNKIYNSNGKRLRLDSFNPLTNKDLVALQMLFNVSSNGITLFIK